MFIQDGSNQSTDLTNGKIEKISVWHWLVLIGIGSGMVIEGFIPHSFGVLIANFQFNNSISNASQFQLSWLPVLSSGLPCALLPIFTVIINQYEYYYQLFAAVSFIIFATSCALSSLFKLWWILIFTYSLLYSIGGSIFISITVLITAEYFPVKHKFHILATSIFHIGYPIASTIGNPIMAVLIVKFNWQISFRIIALVDLVCGLIIAILMKPLSKKGFCLNVQKSSEMTTLIEESDNSLNDKNLTFKSLFKFFKNYRMWPWLIGKYINCTCWYGMRTNFVTYLVKYTTFGLTNSALLMSVYAGSEIVVIIIASVIGDKFRGWLIHVHIISTIAMAFFISLYPLAVTSYWTTVLLMISIGAALQMTLIFGYPASVEIGNFEYDMKIGWIVTNLAIGFGIISSPVFGAIMDNFGLNYLFYAQTCGWLLQTFLFGLTLALQKCEDCKMQNQSEN